MSKNIESTRTNDSASERDLPSQHDGDESIKGASVDCQQTARDDYLQAQKLQRQYRPATAISIGFRPVKDGEGSVTGFEIVFDKSEQPAANKAVKRAESDPERENAQRIGAENSKIEHEGLVSQKTSDRPQLSATDTEALVKRVERAERIRQLQEQLRDSPDALIGSRIEEAAGFASRDEDSVERNSNPVFGARKTFPGMHRPLIERSVVPEIIGRPTNPFSVQETQKGNIIEQHPVQKSEKSFALGLSYEDLVPADNRSPGEKFGDFVKAATARATDPEGWKRYCQGQVEKMIGIGEGLNKAKEDTKGAAVEGWKALTDGRVVTFLSHPNAINEPLFSTIGSAFDAMAKDPNAVNRGLQAIGAAVVQASDHYSRLPDREKGMVIGEAMFAFINPEGSTEAAESALTIANRVGSKLDDAVGGIIQGVKELQEFKGAVPKDIVEEVSLAKKDGVFAMANNHEAAGLGGRKPPKATEFPQSPGNDFTLVGDDPASLERMEGMLEPVPQKLDDRILKGAREALEAMPAEDLAAIEDAGYRVHCAETLKHADPTLDSVTSQAFGVTNLETKQVIIGERSPGLFGKKYLDRGIQPKDVALHELGHAVDDVYGISEQPEIKELYKEIRKDLVEELNAAYKEQSDLYKRVKGKWDATSKAEAADLLQSMRETRECAEYLHSGSGLPEVVADLYNDVFGTGSARQPSTIRYLKEQFAPIAQKLDEHNWYRPKPKG
jgi:hypothetical protein